LDVEIGKASISWHARKMRDEAVGQRRAGIRLVAERQRIEGTSSLFFFPKIE